MLARLTAALAAYGQRRVAGVTLAMRLSWPSSAPGTLLLDGRYTEAELRSQLTAYQQAPWWRRWYQRCFTRITSQAEVFYYGKLTQWLKTLSAAPTQLQQLGALQQLSYELLLAKTDISIFSPLYRPIRQCLHHLRHLEEQAILSSALPRVSTAPNTTSSLLDKKASSTPLAVDRSVALDDFHQHLGHAGYYYEQLVTALQGLAKGKKPQSIDPVLQTYYQHFDYHCERAQLFCTDSRMMQHITHNVDQRLDTLAKLAKQTNHVLLPLQQRLLTRQLDRTVSLFGPSFALLDNTPAHRTAHRNRIMTARYRLQRYYQYYAKAIASRITPTDLDILRDGVNALWKEFCQAYEKLLRAYRYEPADYETWRHHYVREREKILHECQQLIVVATSIAAETAPKETKSQSPATSDKSEIKGYDQAIQDKKRQQLREEIQQQRQYLDEIAYRHNRLIASHYNESVLMREYRRQHQAAQLLYATIMQRWLHTYPLDASERLKGEQDSRQEQEILTTQLLPTVSSQWQEMKAKVNVLSKALQAKQEPLNEQQRLQLQTQYFAFRDGCQRIMQSVNNNLLPNLVEAYDVWQSTLLFHGVSSVLSAPAAEANTEEKTLGAKPAWVSALLYTYHCSLFAIDPNITQPAEIKHQYQRGKWLLSILLQPSRHMKELFKQFDPSFNEAFSRQTAEPVAKLHQHAMCFEKNWLHKRPEPPPISMEQRPLWQINYDYWLGKGRKLRARWLHFKDQLLHRLWPATTPIETKQSLGRTTTSEIPSSQTDSIPSATASMLTASTTPSITLVAASPLVPTISTLSPKLPARYTLAELETQYSVLHTAISQPTDELCTNQQYLTQQADFSLFCDRCHDTFWLSSVNERLVLLEKIAHWHIELLKRAHTVLLPVFLSQATIFEYGMRYDEKRFQTKFIKKIQAKESSIISYIIGCGFFDIDVTLQPDQQTFFKKQLHKSKQKWAVYLHPDKLRNGAEFIVKRSDLFTLLDNRGKDSKSSYYEQLKTLCEDKFKEVNIWADQFEDTYLELPKLPARENWWLKHTRALMLGKVARAVCLFYQYQQLIAQLRLAAQLPNPTPITHSYHLRVERSISMPSTISQLYLSDEEPSVQQQTLVRAYQQQLLIRTTDHYDFVYMHERNYQRRNIAELLKLSFLLYPYIDGSDSMQERKRVSLISTSHDLSVFQKYTLQQALSSMPLQARGAYEGEDSFCDALAQCLAQQQIMIPIDGDLPADRKLWQLSEQYIPFPTVEGGILPDEKRPAVASDDVHYQQFLCQRLGIKVHIFRLKLVDGAITAQHSLVTATGEVSVERINYIDCHTLHLAVFNQQYVPLYQHPLIVKLASLPTTGLITDTSIHKEIIHLCKLAPFEMQVRLEEQQEEKRIIEHVEELKRRDEREKKRIVELEAKFRALQAEESQRRDEREAKIIAEQTKLKAEQAKLSSQLNTLMLVLQSNPQLLAALAQPAEAKPAETKVYDPRLLPMPRTVGELPAPPSIPSVAELPAVVGEPDVLSLAQNGSSPTSVSKP